MNVHHLELFYFVAKHGGIAAAAWNRPNLRTKGISAPGEGRHRAAQCHSKCLSRERSYDRLRNIDAKGADRAKKAPLSNRSVECGPRTSVSLAGLVSWSHFFVVICYSSMFLWFILCDFILISATLTARFLTIVSSCWSSRSESNRGSVARDR